MDTNFLFERKRYRGFITSRKISMHAERKYVERMEIDWVGDKLKYIDLSGKQFVACFFATTLEEVLILI